VRPLVTTVNCVKTADSIELPFRVVGRVGPIEPFIRPACRLVPPGKYGSMIVRGGYQLVCQQCGDAALSQITLGDIVTD